jgi:guanylate kinase
VQQARDVLLDIDVQGARQVRQAVHGTGLESVALFVFCGPPSFAELERRLRARASDPEEVIQRRLRNARTELQAWREYEYVVINRTVPEAVRDLAAVVDAFRCRASRFDPEIWNDD